MKKFFIGFISGLTIVTTTLVFAVSTELIQVSRNTINISVNGQEINEDNFIYEGRTYVQLRSIGETLGKNIEWNSEKRIASINDKDYIDISKIPDYIDNQLSKPKLGEEVVILKTNLGDIKIKLFPQVAPKAVENFVTHCKNGYYENVIFHRVIKDFMIQSGDPLGNGTGGESIWGENFENETSGKLYHFKGALSMANSGPNKNGSQFFIVQNKKVPEGFFEYLNTNNIKVNDTVKDKYLELGGTPHLDGSYSIFGQVYDGLDIVDQISNVEVDKATAKPVEDIVILSTEVQQYERR